MLPSDGRPQTMQRLFSPGSFPLWPWLDFITRFAIASQAMYALAVDSEAIK
jgi:hypothetical protein